MNLPFARKTLRRQWIGAALLLLSCTSLGASLRANAPGGGNGGGADVTLDDKETTVVLANGVLAATVNKAAASVSSLRFKGQEMVTGGVYYSMDGGKDYRTPTGCQYRVKTQTADLVDIALTRKWKDEPQAFDIEVHYVLTRGATGLYSYALLTHPASYPATGYGEWRAVWKLSNELLEKIYVDDLRHWQMPSAADYKAAKPTGIKEIIQLTTGPWAGKYDCKYDYNASYYDLGCWGHASDRNKVGAWIVLGGYDFLNDGPTKQDLNAASGINHLHFGMNHYNGSTLRVAAGQEWQKIYGPFLLYCNASDEGADACWADAKAQVKTEKFVWPYHWLTDTPAYPTDRLGMTGHLVVHDALKPALNAANAWVGLAQPPPGGNWQFDSASYQYWTCCRPDGTFALPNIRPGTYTLSAFVDGAVGEFSQAGVKVSEDGVMDQGSFVWNVPHHGKKIAWEIGVPDRTAREFRHGQDYFHGYVWQGFTRELKNPLEYTVGVSKPETDWNYAQSQWVVPGAPAVPHPWKIHFKLAEAPAGDATLTLAIASADHARIDVTVNDAAKPLATVVPAVQGGNALLRESIHAKYCVEYVTIPAGALRAGENVITLTQTNVSGPGNHVMYDYLSLELP